jgi:hypothetical protein
MTGDDPDQKHSNDTKVTATTNARITEYQKDRIVKAVQSGVIELDGMLKYYKVSSVDELNFAQAQEVIKKKI